jgi:plasmid stabilization system protein ParE
MKVTFEPAASDDLDCIFAWIAKDNPRAALNMTRSEQICEHRVRAASG